MSLNPKILIIDNDNSFQSNMQFAFGNDYNIDAARDLIIVDKLINNNKYDLVLCDLAMDKGDVDIVSGIERISEFKEKYPNIPLIVVTKHHGTELIIKALKEGADDFLFKYEYDIVNWQKKFEKNLKLRNVGENIQLTNVIQKEFGFIGSDPKILETKKILKGIGKEKSPVTILKTGETGVGKEVAARYLHQNSIRRDKPFQAVHLSAISDTLLENSLFDYNKETIDSKSGYLQKADGGVLFLDEIDDISLSTQLKLLRFINNKSIRITGTNQDVHLDILIVAATSKDLEKEIKKGSFRKDLYKQIKKVEVELPPLRDRKEDITKIIAHYLNTPEKNLLQLIESTALDKVLSYHFPGNVRELRNAIEYMQLWQRIKKKAKIDSDCLPIEIIEYDPIKGYQTLKDKIIDSENKISKLKNNQSKVEELKVLAQLYQENNEIHKAEKIIEEATELEKAIRFKENAKNNLIINEIRLDNFAFFEDLSWQVHPRMNILLGKNGYGKTFLLKIMASLLQNDSKLIDDVSSKYKGKYHLNLHLTKGKDRATIHHYDKLFDEPLFGKVPILAISDDRSIDRNEESIKKRAHDFSLDLLENGAKTFLFDESSEGHRIEQFLGLIGHYIESGEKELIELIKNTINNLGNTSFDFSNKIKTHKSNIYLIEVITENNPGTPIIMQKLSRGTHSIIGVFGIIYEFLKELQQQRKTTGKITDEHGIVFIDEIDAHLHPSWQQKIVSILRNTFPKVQFFLSAHSPLIVSGCNSGEVAVLRKNEQGLEVEVINQDISSLNIRDSLYYLFDVSELQEIGMIYFSALYSRKQSSEKMKELNTIYERLMNSVVNETGIIGEGIQDKISKIKELQDYKLKEQRYLSDLEIKGLTADNKSLIEYIDTLKVQIKQLSN